MNVIAPLHFCPRRFISFCRVIYSGSLRPVILTSPQNEGFLMKIAYEAAYNHHWVMQLNKQRPADIFAHEHVFNMVGLNMIYFKHKCSNIPVSMWILDSFLFWGFKHWNP